MVLSFRRGSQAVQRQMQVDLNVVTKLGKQQTCPAVICHADKSRIVITVRVSLCPSHQEVEP
jgi:hypothetical protein